jgi:CDP-glycerol glycerophosphotransferase
MPLISVIIPVYDVAQYLPECLDSVLGQAVGSIEVIAVDDASADGSGQLLDDRAAADPRLRVVHLESNAGPGHARNTGLATACGDYAWFIDGDDRLEDGALAAIEARLTTPGGRPDVLLIDWVSRYPDGRTEPSPGRGILARVPAEGCTLAQLPRLIDLTMTSWSKLLRRDFLDKLGVTFAAGIHEDVLVTCAALLAAESIAAVDRVCYRYRRDRRGSFMATTSTGHLAIFSSYERVFDLVAAQRAASVEVSEAVQAAIFERAIWHYTTVFQTPLFQTPLFQTPLFQTTGGLVPRGERRRFFARMHEDFTRYRPAGYRHPPGARGLKFRLIERGAYRTYCLLEPLNEVRVAVARLAGRPGIRRTWQY